MMHDDPTWPPDPATIDLYDPAWLTTAQAAGVARCSERLIRKIIAAHDVSILIGGRRFVHRGRLFAALLAS